MRICLLTSLHLSYNPRVLKEADALHAAGHHVRVIAMRLETQKHEWDCRLMANRSWRLCTLNASRGTLPGRLAWGRASVRQRLYQHSAKLRSRPGGLERAYSRFLPELTGLAGREPADLFLAHTLPALPAAAYAARSQRAKLGFDAEDYHSGELTTVDGSRTPLLGMAEAIEQTYIPRCDYLSAASDGIGEAYASALDIPTPLTILNVFPLSERRGGTPPAELANERPGSGLSLYWYSQVIGSDRGLDDVLRAMALAGPGLWLSLRGTWDPGYEPTFRRRVEQLGLRDRVRTLPCAPPEQLIERAAQHDVGLATEPGDRPNNRIAASNKLFAYFLAGLAIVASDVPGQRRIMAQAPTAGILFKPGDAEGLAQSLKTWLQEPEKLRACRQAASRYGEDRFCWDVESAKLIQNVNALAPSSLLSSGSQAIGSRVATP